MSGSSGTGRAYPAIRLAGQHVISPGSVQAKGARLPGPLGRYMQWLHTGWPAGTVERLPEAREDGTTALPGVRIVGDLTGIPLLKFSSDTGARAVQSILAEPDFAKGRGGDPEVAD